MDLGKQFVNSNLLLIVNEVISDITVPKTTFKINVKVDNTVIDCLSCTNGFILKSDVLKKSYNLNDNFAIMELLLNYSNLNEPMYNSLLKQSIIKKMTKKNNDQADYNNWFDNLKKPKKQYSCSSSSSPSSVCSKDSKLVKKIAKKFNASTSSSPSSVCSKDTKLVKKIAKKSNASTSSSPSSICSKDANLLKIAKNLFSETDEEPCEEPCEEPFEEQQYLQKPTFVLTKIPDQTEFNKIKENTKETTIVVENNICYDLTDDEKNILEKMNDDEIQKAILKLETIKNDIDKELEYDLEVEESRKLRKAKEEKRRVEEKRSIFESDKSFTYKKIYADMFINTNKNGDHYIQSLDQIPELFIVKYAIFLYMDGRNVEGELVRERLLDREEEYDIYEMLYNVLTDEKYIVPDDERLQSIVEDFINTLPPIQIITEEQIMKALNDPNDPIFNEDETSQCSADDTFGDTKINTYER